MFTFNSGICRLLLHNGSWGDVASIVTRLHTEWPRDRGSVLSSSKIPSLSPKPPDMICDYSFEFSLYRSFSPAKKRVGPKAHHLYSSLTEINTLRTGDADLFF